MPPKSWTIFFSALHGNHCYTFIDQNCSTSSSPCQKFILHFYSIHLIRKCRQVYRLIYMETPFPVMFQKFLDGTTLSLACFFFQFNFIGNAFDEFIAKCCGKFDGYLIVFLNHLHKSSIVCFAVIQFRFFECNQDQTILQVLRQFIIPTQDLLNGSRVSPKARTCPLFG